jgi:hypothetical protein
MTVDGGDDFVIVETVGPDVRVRAIRVASTSDECYVPLIEAVERTVPRTTVAAVAGIAVCSITENHVEQALKDAPPARHSTVDFIGRIDAVVAECGNSDKEFVFVMPPRIDHDQLRRNAPEVQDLWDLGHRMRAIALDRSPLPDLPFDNTFNSFVPEVRAARQALGTAMVPVLLSGKYKDYLVGAGLASYRRAPAVRDALWVEVVDLARLNLDEYVEPMMPPIARSGRIAGDVNLRLRVNATSGAVDEVELLPGASPLLAPTTVDAVRRWKFNRDGIPRVPVDVRVVFRQRCPPRFQ